MAKYQVKHKCGHEVTTELFGKQTDRNWKLEKMANEICWECEKNERNVAAIESAKENNLPKLQGSEKQIAWAMSIRAEKLEKHGNIPALIEKTGAKWWIDNRNGSEEIRKIVDEYENMKQTKERSSKIKNAFEKMTKSEIFKRVHAFTKKMLAGLTGISYHVQFAINLKWFYAEIKKALA